MVQRPQALPVGAQSGYEYSLLCETAAANVFTLCKPNALATLLKKCE